MTNLDILSRVAGCLRHLAVSGLLARLSVSGKTYNLKYWDYDPTGKINNGYPYFVDELPEWYNG